MGLCKVQHPRRPKHNQHPRRPHSTSYSGIQHGSPHNLGVRVRVRDKLGVSVAAPPTTTHVPPPCDAWYDRCCTFRLKWFLKMTERLNPKSSETGLFFCLMILVVYLGNGNFHPVAVYSSPKSVLGEVLRSPKLRNLGKISGAPLS